MIKSMDNETKKFVSKKSLRSNSSQLNIKDMPGQLKWRGMDF